MTELYGKDGLTPAWQTRLRAEVYESAGLTPAEIQLMEVYLAGDDDFYGSSSYEKLYGYFAFEAALMPYDIAKARTGDPDLWILEYLEKFV
jgi:hypothetical protein